MSNRDNLTAEPAGKIEKIKTPFAVVIVGGQTERPCYSVMWWDTIGQEYNIGYSSYNIAFVFDWLEAYFEVDQNAKHPHELTLDDLRPKGRWVDGNCSMCGASIPTDNQWDFIDESDCHYCPNCGADMRGGGEDG